ncbi:MAG: peptidylprolyl isomerase [Verrucomicrobia bacterium]|nr:peptidylprolyl isomerase [Verrucomicrobiota bacterium]
MTALDPIFRAVLDASWRASALVIVVLALRPLLRGHLPARVVFWIWIAVAARLLLPITLPVAWSPFNLTSLAHPPTFGRVLDLDTAELPAAFAGPDLPATAGATLAASRPARASLTPLPWVAVVWAAGVAALLLARTWVYVRFLRRLRRSSTEPSPALLSLLRATADRMGVRPVRLALTAAVGAPALQGIFRPTLLVPPGFLDPLTPEEIQAIFAHELAHAQRRDLLAQSVIHAAAILHWVNPLVWVVARLARHDCELACDAQVIRRMSAPERELYGATLLKTVTLAHGLTPPPLGLGVVEFKQQIKRRIHMIVAHQSSRPVLTVLGCALFALVTGLSLTREVHAQPSPAPAVSAPAAAAPLRTITVPPGQDEPLPDTLDQLFPSGTVATIGDRVVTVTDVRREMGPLSYRVRQDAHSPEELKQKALELQNSVITGLIQRILIIKEFPIYSTADGARHIAAEAIDAALAEVLQAQYGNDRAKLLEALQSRNMTMSDYRKSLEEEIIYRYMMKQATQWRRPAQSMSQEGKTHLRLIQLSRAEGETDEALRVRANAALARFRNGEKFEDLARELSNDTRKSKGGDWGWLGSSDVKPEFRGQFAALKKGEASAPIVITEGAFLLYADDRK